MKPSATSHAKLTPKFVSIPVPKRNNCCDLDTLVTSRAKNRAKHIGIGSGEQKTKVGYELVGLAG